MQSFYDKLLLPLRQYTNGEIDIEKIRESLLVINKYFFNNYPEIGKTYIEEWDYKTEYFSDFHILWEEKAEEILAPEINDEKCRSAANVLHRIRQNFGDAPFLNPINLLNLDHANIALVRFLTANQDFRGSRNTEDFFRLFIDSPAVFDLNRIYENPSNFLNGIGITDLSQNDKREKFAKTAANFLLEKDIDAFGIGKYFNNDALAIKDALINTIGMGYGNKKADMFLRDMIVWGIWPNLASIDQINVASDINTIKVALRAGIIKTKLSPLLSSFLDIFCHQYSTIDLWVSKAWRRVWELWRDNNPTTAPFGPSFMDFFLYRIIGKDFCQENLYEFQGINCGHTFFWHSSRNKACLVCQNLYRNNFVSFEENDGEVYAICNKHRIEHRYKVENRRKKKCQICENINNGAVVINTFLPCTKDEGYIAISNSEFVRGENSVLPNITVCPFSDVCLPMSTEFKKLNPPKSISILGRTGWESAKTNIENGGGGLMS
jgi:hypothetical protein